MIPGNETFTELLTLVYCLSITLHSIQVLIVTYLEHYNVIIIVKCKQQKVFLTFNSSTR